MNKEDLLPAGAGKRLRCLQHQHVLFMNREDLLPAGAGKRLKCLQHQHELFIKSVVSSAFAFFAPRGALCDTDK